MNRTFNFRTPVGITVSLIGILLAVLVVFMVLGGLGFRFDPFDLMAKRLTRAEQSGDKARLDANARRIEAEGAIETLRRVEQVTIQIRAAEQIAFQSATAAAEAPDANTPVDPARLDRLRIADDSLCQLRPDICTDTTTSPDSATGGSALFLAPSP